MKRFQTAEVFYTYFTFARFFGGFAVHADHPKAV